MSGVCNTSSAILSGNRKACCPRPTDSSLPESLQGDAGLVRGQGVVGTIAPESKEGGDGVSLGLIQAAEAMLELPARTGFIAAGEQDEDQASEVVPVEDVREERREVKAKGLRREEDQGLAVAAHDLGRHVPP